jgi:hypothetical protein
MRFPSIGRHSVEITSGCGDEHRTRFTMLMGDLMSQSFFSNWSP